MNNDVFIAAFTDELEKLADVEAVFLDSFFDELEKRALIRRPRARRKMLFKLKREGQPDVMMGSGRQSLRAHPTRKKGPWRRFFSPSESPVLRAIGRIRTKERHAPYSAKARDVEKPVRFSQLTDEAKGRAMHRVTVGGKVKRGLSRVSGGRRAKMARQRHARLIRDADAAEALAARKEAPVAEYKRLQTQLGVAGKGAGKKMSQEEMAQSFRDFAKRRRGQAASLEKVLKPSEKTFFGRERKGRLSGKPKKFKPAKARKWLYPGGTSWGGKPLTLEQRMTRTGRKRVAALEAKLEARFKERKGGGKGKKKGQKSAPVPPMRPITGRPVAAATTLPRTGQPAAATVLSRTGRPAAGTPAPPQPTPQTAGATS